MKNFSVIILAAGLGTRMKSSLPKVMHNLSGKPLIKWVIDSVFPLRPDNIVVVVGYRHEIVEEYLSKSNVNVKFICQERQLGTAHAVMQAKEILKNYNGNIVVISGDVPLIKTTTISSLIKNNQKNGSAFTVLSAEVKDPYGYGRIVRKDGFLEKIVEEKDSNLSEKQIKEINSGIYCFDKNLWKALLKVEPNNAKKEYYITDTIAILKKLNHKVSVLLTKDEVEIKGINTKLELSQAETLLKNQKIEKLLNSGVSIIDVNNVYISYDAIIKQGTVIYPGVFIGVGVTIGRNCVLKGSSYIANSKIDDECIVSYSYVDGATIGKKVKTGPFSHLRPGSVLKENVKIGNFSETKKSLIGKNSKVNHLSYIGDAQIGANVNIGAGTITCNYDGKHKHQTIIEQDVFVGSNANIVAPVKIGKGSLIAAGSTITHDVPKGKLAIARVRQELKRRIKNRL
ncbi:MAG: bifunctional UDP-N-acetylglucosamine diphosphorylase/glucosamine-1-phosphate N-acetyltransferase GlmU [Endomicrobium sp.]|nr:bifunctional UDP-N-acetylglucosamine diphosphorylase/glucosamine-1-phosphate N-acetyltransferase GlmU [Endomicrobium sp.]